MTEIQADSAPGWLRSNRSYYGLLAVLLLASLSYSYFKPKWDLQAKLDAWALRTEVLSTPNAFSAELVAESLAKASTNDQVYGWILMQGIQDALSRGDQESLTTLIRATEDYLDAGNSTGIQAMGPDGPTPALAFALNQARGSSQGTATVLPQSATPRADSPRVSLSLTINGTSGYEVIVGLFPESAPDACEAFLSQVAQGTLVGSPGQRAGSFGIVFKPAPMKKELSLTEEASPGLAPEISWGYFHQPGALSFSQLSGTPNRVDPAALEITIADAYHLDGRTTVFGKVLSGLEALTAHPFGGPSEVDTLESIQIDSVTLLN